MYPQLSSSFQCLLFSLFLYSASIKSFDIYFYRRRTRDSDSLTPIFSRFSRSPYVRFYGGAQVKALELVLLLVLPARCLCGCAKEASYWPAPHMLESYKILSSIGGGAGGGLFWAVATDDKLAALGSAPLT